MEPILTLRNIKKSFDDKIIHQGVAFDLYPSETLGLLGNSGTGKSVLLRSIIGLEYIDEGEIYFKNNRIDLLSERNMYPIRTKISYAFQNGALFDSVNVFENLAYPLFEHTKLDESSIYKKVMDALKLKMNDLELQNESAIIGGTH
jgi:phospholipid/cholesterol/gamma-HCH transport system ATP-binding protein